MDIQIEKQNSVTIVVRGYLAADEVKNRLEQKVAEHAKNLFVPGFRPGHAPKGLILARYGDAIKELVKEEILEEVLKEAREKNEELKETLTISKPKHEPLEPEKEFVVEYTIEVPPKVELKQYKGFTLKRPKVEVTEDEVNREIQDFLIRNAQYVEVKRPVAENDYVEVMFTREGDEELVRALIPLDDPEYAQIFKDFIGKKLGDKFSLTLDFPDSFPDRRFRGTKGEFNFEIIKIYEQKIPELNAEFFKRMGKPETYTEKEFRKEVEEYIKAQKSRASQDVLSQRAIDELVKANPVEIPENYLMLRVDQYLAEKLGGTRITKESLDKLREQVKESMKNQIAFEFIAKAIAEQEKIEVTDSEVEDEIRRLAYSQGIDPNAAVEVFKKDQNRLEEVRESVLRRKVIELVLSTCKIEEEGEEEETEGETEGEKEKSEQKVAKPKSSAKSTGKKTTAKGTAKKSAEVKKDDMEPEKEK